MVDVKRSFDSMDFAAEDKAALEQMKSDLDAALRGFDERAEGYRRTAESTIIMDESVRQNAVAQYHADAEKTKASVAAARAEIDKMVSKINAGMKRAFDAAVAEAVKDVETNAEGAEYVVFPSEAALAVNAQRYPDGSDITGLVVAHLKNVGPTAYNG